jgi:hypothetical protein
LLPKEGAQRHPLDVNHPDSQFFLNKLDDDQKETPVLSHLTVPEDDIFLPQFRLLGITKVLEVLTGCGNEWFRFPP